MAEKKPNGKFWKLFHPEDLRFNILKILHKNQFIFACGVVTKIPETENNFYLEL